MDLWVCHARSLDYLWYFDVIKILMTFRVKDEAEVSSSFDDHSSSVIKLNNSTVLYFREVGHHLAVVCILREENFERRGKYLSPVK